jgi:hypothetical protein
MLTPRLSPAQRQQQIDSANTLWFAGHLLSCFGLILIITAVSQARHVREDLELENTALRHGLDGALEYIKQLQAKPEPEPEPAE